MEYTKPVVLAQNSKEQSFAAGCQERDMGGDCYVKIAKKRNS